MNSNERLRINGMLVNMSFESVMEEVSSLSFEGVEPFDSDLQAYFDRPMDFKSLEQRTNLILSSVWSSWAIPSAKRDFRAMLERWKSDDLMRVDHPGRYASLFIDKIGPEDFHKSAIAKREVMEFASSMGASKIVVGGPFLRKEDRRDEYYHWMAKALEEIGIMCSKYGMEASYQPHLGCIVEGWDDIRKLCDLTNPNLCNLTLDTAHQAAAEVDLEKMIDKYFERINHVHLKDLKGGMFVELGLGELDLLTVVSRLVSKGYNKWIVAELDSTSKVPIEAAAVMKNYIDQELKPRLHQSS